MSPLLTIQTAKQMIHLDGKKYRRPQNTNKTRKYMYVKNWT